MKSKPYELVGWRARVTVIASVIQIVAFTIAIPFEVILFTVMLHAGTK